MSYQRWTPPAGSQLTVLTGDKDPSEVCDDGRSTVDELIIGVRLCRNRIWTGAPMPSLFCLASWAANWSTLPAERRSGASPRLAGIAGPGPLDHRWTRFG